MLPCRLAGKRVKDAQFGFASKVRCPELGLFRHVGVNAAHIPRRNVRQLADSGGAPAW